MGAGAGYNIRGTIDGSSIKINSYEVAEPYFDGKTQIIPIQCNIDCSASDVTAESYYYGGKLYGDIPIKITKMSLIPEFPYDEDFEYIEDISEIDESTIKDALYDLSFDIRIGGGWTHSTFDGDISFYEDDMSSELTDTLSAYPDFVFNELIMHITSKIAIKVLDEYARGENYGDEYRVVNIDGDTLEYFEDYDEAIAYAKENNGYEVWGTRQWYEYALTNGGDDVEVDIIDIDDDIGKDWTNPDYIEE